MNKTIDIPVQHVVALLASHASNPDLPAEPEVTAVFKTLATQPLTAGDTPGTVKLNAETAWWLAGHSDTLGAFHLDECAKETYDIPAIQAEIGVLNLIYDQAPEADVHCRAVMAARYPDVLAA